MNNVKVISFKVPKTSIQYGKNVNFNPSIIHIEDNVFLVSFHTFRRNGGTYYVTADINDKFHPWYGSYNSSTWWNAGSSGFRGTGLMIIKIVDREIIIHSVLPDTNYGSDMRLLKTPSYIFATFNLQAHEYKNWGIDRELYKLPKAKCTENCFAMQYFKAQLYHNTYLDWYTLYKDDNYSLLCSNIQDQDKNWSSFMIDNKLYCSDYLTPTHTVIDINNCSIITEPYVNIMEEIELYYNGGILFSLSTPAIPYNNVMLGIGHLKIIPSFVKHNTVAYDFIHNDSLPRHPLYDQMYMMFLYTFDSNFKILSISPAFYPPDTKHGVIFPAGLTYYNNEYIVSYGEGDVEMKLLFLNKNIIKNLLSNNIQVEYEFLYL